MSEVKANKSNSSMLGFDNLLLVFVAILFVVSVVSAVQLNELSGKIESFEKAPQNKVILSNNTDNTSQDNTAQTDQEILDKLNKAPDMVGGC
jgi:cell division protein FtsX